MPEGPEVKIASTYFNTFFKKSKEINFEIISEYYFEKYSNVFKHIKNNLQNYRKSYTIGKNIFIDLDDKSIFNFHLGMTGGWSQENLKHCHFRVYNSYKELFFKDVRKFGNMIILTKNQLKNKHIAEYDLLNSKYNFKKHFEFLDKSHKSKRSICSILMDQSFFPGVGNYIKSEALYASNIHPEEKWFKLSRSEKISLITKTKTIMLNSYKHGGAELKDFHNPFHESTFNLNIYGKKISSKNTKVVSLKTSDQRKTWFCTKNQRLRK
ncbi:MAG: hypothetical protein CMD26_06470 [Flavobacteriales bacterium]|nr:hypothetical protein [Flavobacteriales bacterium]